MHLFPSMQLAVLQVGSGVGVGGGNEVFALVGSAVGVIFPPFFSVSAAFSCTSTAILLSDG
jgi:hypothetical protein